MTAFVLEVVDSAGVRRGGRTYWTRDAAIREAERLVRLRRAATVRVLEATIRPRPVAEVPGNESEVSCGN